MVQKPILSEVYELLKNKQLVSSESEFSKDWLGRSECYLRILRFKGANPSVGSVAICASKLQHYGARLKRTTPYNFCTNQGELGPSLYSDQICQSTSH